MSERNLPSKSRGEHPFYNRGAEPDIYFWRDSAGHEIDLLIEKGVTQIPIEIESGQTVAGDFFKDLDFWRNLAGQPDSPAGLVYGGDASFRRRREESPPARSRI